MSFNLKAVSAAVVLVASGAANAALENFASGNSSVIFYAVDTSAPVASVGLDLDFNLNDFVPLAGTNGTKIVWDFNTNKRTVNGVVSNSSIDWNSNLQAFFAAGAVSSQTKWGVIAGDSLTDGGADIISYLSTSTATAATVKNQTLANLSSFSAVGGLYDALNDGSGLVATSTTDTAYVAKSGNMGSTQNWNSKATFSASANIGQSQSLVLLDGIVAAGTTNRATVTQFGNAKGMATFTYDAGVLTYAIAAVPEPETYALMLAGLGLIGAAARRRAR